MEKKKILTVLMVLVAYTLILCVVFNDPEGKPVYKPMIYINNALYGETALDSDVSSDEYMGYRYSNL